MLFGGGDDNDDGGGDEEDDEVVVAVVAKQFLLTITFEGLPLRVVVLLLKVRVVFLLLGVHEWIVGTRRILRIGGIFNNDNILLMGEFDPFLSLLNLGNDFTRILQISKSLPQIDGN